jgi:5-methylcytosine-specific restriction protein A
MPLMPPRRCSTCHQLVTGRCACRPAWKSSRPVQRIRGRQLQQLRLDLWTRDPHCRLCLRLLLPHEGVRDHIVNLHNGGLDVDSNTQLLCETCHRAKTQQEAQRGREAAR